jgi:GT2 family glycosyltransferase
MSIEGTKVSLVTVTYNAEKFIEMFMTSLLAQKITGTLVVVDNASKDQTLCKLKQYGTSLGTINIVILAQTQNVGVAEGNNIGIRWSMDWGADVVILLNNDVEFAPCALTMLVEHALDSSTVTVPTIFYGDDKHKVWFGGGAMVPSRGLSVHRYNIPERDLTEINYSPTCCMAIPATLFKKIGLMNADYFVYFDDTDFCARLNANGVPINLLRDSQLYHYVSSSTGGDDSPLSIYFGTRNRLYFMRANITGVNRIISFIYFILTRLIKLLLYTAKGESTKTESMLLGFKDYMRGRMGQGSFFSRDVDRKKDGWRGQEESANQ